jgi:hypothetical protein
MMVALLTVLIIKQDFRLGMVLFMVGLVVLVVVLEALFWPVHNYLILHPDHFSVKTWSFGDVASPKHIGYENVLSIEEHLDQGALVIQYLKDGMNAEDEVAVRLRSASDATLLRDEITNRREEAKRRGDLTG